MREATDRTTTANLLFRGYTNADLWLDDVRFSDTGIVDVPTPDTTRADRSGHALSASTAPLTPAARSTCPGRPPPTPSASPATSSTAAPLPGTYGAPTTLGNVTTYTDATAVDRHPLLLRGRPRVDAAGNESAKSPEADATALDNSPPATPTGLAATPGISSIALSWNANSEPDLLGYNVYYNGIKHNALPVTSTSYTHFGLLASTVYSYRITAVDIAGDESAPSAAVIASSLDFTAPGPPPSLTAADTPGDTGGSISLSWTAATDDVAVTGYRVRRGTVSGSYDTTFTLGAVTSYADATAVTGTRYYYAVRAVDAAGNLGNPSPEASAVAVDNGGVLPPAAFDGTFESGTDGASARPRPGRCPAPPSAPSTTPLAPRTAPCPAGSRARRPPRPQAPRFRPS